MGSGNLAAKKRRGTGFLQEETEITEWGGWELCFLCLLLLYHFQFETALFHKRRESIGGRISSLF